MLPPVPWNTWTRAEGVFGSPVNSAASTPARVSRHSSESAPPVETAMFGRLANIPSEWFLGRLMLPAGLSWHAVTLGTMISLRHLPIWTTSGMFFPAGAFLMVNVPSGAVIASAMGSSPSKSAPHEQDELLMPSGMRGSVPPCVFGMNVTTP